MIHHLLTITKRSGVALLLCCFATLSYAQDKKVIVTGSIQSDILIPQDDDAIGT